MELSTGASATRSFRFGQFTLVPARHVLLRDGVPIPIGSRALDILTILVERNGELVGKDALLNAAWPGIFVHESNLKVNICSLRRALGDTQKQPTYVATIPGRGYRFVAAVEIVVSAPTDPGIRSKTETLRELPAQPELIGREGDVTALCADLRNKAHVTVVGAGGIGKTTVAVAAARALAAQYPDGVCFVDLSTFDDPTLVPGALATALGIRGNPGNMLAAVLDYLRPRQILVLLDNCEHVLPAAAIFATRLAAEQGASKLLATSREPLGTQAEHVIRLDSLPFPNAGETVLTVDAAMRFPALELFARRASEWAGHSLHDSDCGAVAGICRVLDGLPLAIELAAAQMERHTAQEVAAMLDAHLGFGNRRAAAGPARHETLMATIDWSFELLSRTEATVLRVVSVFADGFELEDVVAVAEAPALTPVAVTVGLGGLVAKSLMGAEANGAGLRYRLLDSTRRYALERLKADPVAPRVRRHHAERVLAIFERSEAEWVRHETGDWTARYRSRLPDLRAALCWAFGNDGDAALGLRLTAAAIPLWFETSLLAEGQAQVELALARAADIPCDNLLKTKLASFRAWAMSYARKLAPELEQVWRDAIGFAERAGSVQHQLQALVGLAFHLMDIGKVAASIDCLEAFESLSASHQDLSAGPEGARALALARAYTGALSESRNVLERLAATYSHPKRGSRMAGFQVDRYIGIRNYLSLVAWLNGSPDHAATKAGKAVDAAESLGHLASQSCVLALAAVPVAFLNGDARALARYTGKLRSILELESIGIWMPIERFFSGALDDMRGEPGAIGAMQDAIDAFIDCGIRSRIPLYLGILADALTRSGRLDEAGDTIAMAFQHQTQQGARWCRSELQRIEASLFRRAGRNAQAERLLHHALEEAQAIDALGFELRIATDLADLYVATQRGTDARHLLEPVYSKFREGFGRRDLIQAARLLQRADTAAA